ncbi:hypothetical protein K466DRAFT_605737 [Polyporus arcularius HHB13444]|uniref:Uncharacterized protein n=1 Tax=Polyporus arcularius HHB13444 TaxID=1314778 RepID=A0A5C3NRJ6_9APHY|nr:hypothetical protein K466DRAFT_605737 [Polyporus arcularius HHB13444]
MSQSSARNQSHTIAGHATPPDDPSLEPSTPRKRSRPHSENPLQETPNGTLSAGSTPATPQPAEKLAVPFNSPKGRKIAHINISEYVAQTNDLVTDTWVSPETSTYLYKFINYNNPLGTRFPIHRVPANLHWTVVDEDPRFMQVTHLNRPLLIWILGALVDASLVTTRAFPTPRVRVVIDFLRERDRQAAVALYNKAASQTLTHMDTLETTAPADDNEGPPSYEEIYDARQCFADKSKMSSISQAKLFSGDIVLAECSLVRAETSTSKTVMFSLNTLYWMAESPRAGKTPVLFKQPPFPDVITYS